MTDEEAQKAWYEAVPVPISEGRIKEIVDYVLNKDERIKAERLLNETMQGE